MVSHLGKVTVIANVITRPILIGVGIPHFLTEIFLGELKYFLTGIFLGELKCFENGAAVVFAAADERVETFEVI